MAEIIKSSQDCKIVDATDGSKTLGELLTLSQADPTALFITPFGVIKGGSIISDTPILGEGVDNGKAVTVSIAGKTSNEFLIPYANSAKDLTGHSEPTNEEFTFRASAGEKSIRDDNASIESIKGNSVVFNQLVKQDKTFNYSHAAGVTIRIKPSGILTISGTITKAFTITLPLGTATIDTPTQNHYYLYGSLTELPLGFSIGILGFGGTVFNVSTSLLKIAQCQTPSSGGLYFTGNGGQVVGTEYNWEGKLLFIDLTKMFGSGNEPTTVEEFYQRLPKGVDLNAYNEGEIVNFVPESIKTTGFNQFNGAYAKVCAGVSYYFGGTYTSIGFTTEEGGTTEEIALSNNKYTPSQNGYIYAEGSDICINLSHSGYRDGEYEAYKEFTHDLSWVKKYFPNGMRSAGSARDEIRFNSTTQKWEAVQRVGVSAFVEGDDTDTTMTTDGTNTNYELAEPIVTEITDIIDMNYNVYDFGTEELLIAEGGKSSPFNGDIVYQFNAVDRIRDAERNINQLKEDVDSSTRQVLTLIGEVNRASDLLDISNITPIGGGKNFLPNTSINDLKIGYVVYAKGTKEEYWYTGVKGLYGIDIGDNTSGIAETIYITAEPESLGVANDMTDALDVYFLDATTGTYYRSDYFKLLKISDTEFNLYDSGALTSVHTFTIVDSDSDALTFESWNLVGGVSVQDLENLKEEMNRTVLNAINIANNIDNVQIGDPFGSSVGSNKLLGTVVSITNFASQNTAYVVVYMQNRFYEYTIDKSTKTTTTAQSPQITFTNV